MNSLAPTTRRLLRDALLIALAGVLLGLAVNFRLVRSAFDGSASQAAVATPATTELYPQPVGLTELRSLLAAGALPVDARAGELFATGHLPGAVSFPLESARTTAQPLAGQLPSGRMLVLYCSGYGCSDSFDLAVLLLAAGYREVRVFEGGLPAWQDAGLPIVREAP